MSPAVWIALLAVFLILFAGRRRARNLRRRDRRRRKESRVSMNEMIRQLLGKRCVVCLDGGFGGSLTGVLEALEDNWLSVRTGKTGALELVVDRVSADSGYERTLALDGDACRITLTDGDTVIDESAVEYLGLSDNGEYYLFRWTWEGQTDEEADWYRYAVPLDGSAVIWRGESLPESTDFDQMLVQ